MLNLQYGFTTQYPVSLDVLYRHVPDHLTERQRYSLLSILCGRSTFCVLTSRVQCVDGASLRASVDRAALETSLGRFAIWLFCPCDYGSEVTETKFHFAASIHRYTTSLFLLADVEGFGMRSGPVSWALSTSLSSGSLGRIITAGRSNVARQDLKIIYQAIGRFKNKHRHSCRLLDRGLRHSKMSRCCPYRFGTVFPTI